MTKQPAQPLVVQIDGETYPLPKKFSRADISFLARCGYGTADIQSQFDVVAAAIAMRRAHPDWTPRQVREFLAI